MTRRDISIIKSLLGLCLVLSVTGFAREVKIDDVPTYIDCTNYTVTSKTSDCVTTGLAFCANMDLSAGATCGYMFYHNGSITFNNALV